MHFVDSLFVPTLTDLHVRPAEVMHSRIHMMQHCWSAVRDADAMALCLLILLEPFPGVGFISRSINLDLRSHFNSRTTDKQ